MNDFVSRKDVLNAICKDKCGREFDGKCEDCRIAQLVQGLQPVNEKLK